MPDFTLNRQGRILRAENPVEGLRPFPSIAAFRRVGRSIGDAELVEVTDVLWLQVGEMFADIRFPRAGSSSTISLDLSQAFSGFVAIAGSLITWTHDMDTIERPPGKIDDGTFEWEGDILLEVGEDYVEHWDSLGQPQGSPGQVAEYRGPMEERQGHTPAAALHSRIVRVGSLAVAVWSSPFPGGALLEADPQWHVVNEVGYRWTEGDFTAVVEAMAASNPLPARWEHIL